MNRNILARTREVIFTLTQDWSGHPQSALGAAFYKGHRWPVWLGWWGVWIPGFRRNDWINWDCLGLAGMWSSASCIWKLSHRKAFGLHMLIFLTPENERKASMRKLLETAFKPKYAGGSQKLDHKKNRIGCFLFRCLHKLVDYFEGWYRENWIILVGVCNSDFRPSSPGSVKMAEGLQPLSGIIPTGSVLSSFKL